MFQVTELSQLSHEVRILLRIHRILMLQLRGQKLKKFTFAQVLSTRCLQVKHTVIYSAYTFNRHPTLLPSHHNVNGAALNTLPTTSSTALFSPFSIFVASTLGATPVAFVTGVAVLCTKPSGIHVAVF